MSGPTRRQKMAKIQTIIRFFDWYRLADEYKRRPKLRAWIVSVVADRLKRDGLKAHAAKFRRMVRKLSA